LARAMLVCGDHGDSLTMRVYQVERRALVSSPLGKVKVVCNGSR
jgi:hypothetical protein